MEDKPFLSNLPCVIPAFLQAVLKERRISFIDDPDKEKVVVMDSARNIIQNI